MADKIDKKSLMADFEVLYIQNHGGTFNGCLETLGISIESFLKTRVRDALQAPVVFDYRTSVGKCFEFLMGRRKPFYLLDNTGQETKEIRQLQQALFTDEANDLIEAWLDARNVHTHEGPLYPMMASFKNILIPSGDNHVLIFNPGNPPQHILRIDERGDLVPDNYQLVLRSKKASDNVDMLTCEHYHADLIFEVLTKKVFEDEKPNAPWHSGEHALVITYGVRTFYVCFSRATYKKLKASFGYAPKTNWKTHYFRFKAESIFAHMTRGREPSATLSY